MDATHAPTTAAERIAALIDLAAEHDEPVAYLELVALLEAEQQRSRLRERREPLRAEPRRRRSR
jgi:hypothetical protein